jgi:hypothetical protein
MPRRARIDAPGALHHIIVRGIERRSFSGKILIFVGCWNRGIDMPARLLFTLE